jgi:dsRNA-specific ribonuclease
MIKCYKTYPTYEEGELANLTSMITCNGTFAVLAVKMGLHRLYYTINVASSF